MDKNTYTYYEQHAQQYSEQTRQLDVMQVIYQFISLLPPHAHVADLGCAGGRDLRIMRELGLHAVGVEASPELARLAQEYSQCRVITGDISHIPEIPDHSLDGIWVCATLVHSNSLEWNNILKEIFRIARYGATIFISTKYGKEQYVDTMGRVFWLYSPEQCKQMIQNYDVQLLSIMITQGKCTSSPPSYTNMHVSTNTTQSTQDSPSDGIMAYPFIYADGTPVASRTEMDITWINIWIRTSMPEKAAADESLALTWETAKAWGKIMLDSYGIENSLYESRWLLEHIVGDMHTVLSLQEEQKYFAAIDTRCQHCPLDYILGKREFGDLLFYVTPDVLIPRPETELIVMYVLSLFQANYTNTEISANILEDLVPILPCANPVGLDLGTGSGCIAIMLLKHMSTLNMIATDISQKALDICQKNAKMHMVLDRLQLSRGDLWDAIPKGILFDFIVSNPPYIAQDEYEKLMPEVKNYEPPSALLGGKDGVDLYTRILDKCCEYLKPSGIIVLEIGHTQADIVKKMIPSCMHVCSILLDFQGIQRTIVAQKI